MKKVILIICLAFVLGSSSLLFSLDEKVPDEQTAEKTLKMGTRENPYNLPRTDQPPKIDGKIDETVWESGLKIELPYETWPRENVEAPVRTECYLLYDNSCLYVAFKAYDPDPGKIRAYYYERDKFLYDDFVVIFLDTFNDERRAYGFRSNPFGLQWDDIRTRTKVAQGRGVPVAWDAIYNSAGKIYDWGYAVEMAIPFNQLRFQRTKEDQVWGFDLRRIYPRNWMHTIDNIPLDRNNNCLMCQFAKLEGFKGVKPGRNIELVPTLTAVRTDARTEMPAGDYEKLNEDVEAGLTARWGIGTNMALSATVNPDFSQVEADARQLDINEPFALFFEERRPFFYEGSDYFNTNFSAVYTRTMRDPSWGVKLTGKEGAHTVGAYVVRDEITNLIFPGSHSSQSTSLDMANTSYVLRYKLDMGRNVTFGVLGTDREGGDYFNRLAGVDSELRFSRKDSIQMQFLASSTRYPGDIALDFGQEEEKFSGQALDVKYSHDARNWDFSLEYQDLGQGFRADLGYMPQVNYRRGDVSTGYTWIGKRGGWFRELTLGGSYGYSEDQDGNLIYSGGTMQMIYQGPVQSYGILQARKWTESYVGVDFDQLAFTFYWQMRPKRFELTLQCDFGDRIDYSNIRPGERIRIIPIILYKPGRHLRLSLSHIYEKLKVDTGRVYTANVSELSAAYHFNVRAFFRGIVQYVDYDYNADNYLFPITPRYKNLFTQFLFSYLINPRTVFFLGYTDNYDGRIDYPLTQGNWTVFAKISYSWSL